LVFGSIIRDWTSCSPAEAMARMLMPRTKPPTATEKTVDGSPTLIEVLRNGMTADARLRAAPGGRDEDRWRAGERDDLYPEDLEHGRRVHVGQAVADDLVHHEQEGHLQEERETACQWADAALLHQFLLGDTRLGGVTLEPALDLLDLGLEELHPALRRQLPAVERDDDDPDDQRQCDDRPTDGGGHPDRGEQVVDGHQDDEHRLEDRGEEPPAGRSGWRPGDAGWSGGAGVGDGRG
jgi:hypothetical protein